MTADNFITTLFAADKLPKWFPIHHFNEPKWNYAPPGSINLIDLGQKSLWISVGMILFNPIFWNIVARNGKSLSFGIIRMKNGRKKGRDEWRNRMRRVLTAGNVSDRRNVSAVYLG